MFIKMEGLWKNGIRSTPFFHSPLERDVMNDIIHTLEYKDFVNSIIQKFRMHNMNRLS